MRIEILGIPFNGLGTPPDLENPALGLRQANLIPLLQAKGHTVRDLGDVLQFYFAGELDPISGIKDFHAWVLLSERLASLVADMLARRSLPLLLGGDCSMLVGILTAFAHRQKDIGLVFVDGHADFHSAESSPNSDPADMELAVVTGRGPDPIARIAPRYPLIDEERVVVFGIRAWDQIADSRIRVYDCSRLRETGIANAVSAGIGDFVEKGLPLWLHFDVDVIDPEFMPVMFPEPGGLTFEETRDLLDTVWTRGRVAGLSVACYHPRLDRDGQAGARIARLIAEVLAKPCQAASSAERPNRR